MRRLSIKWKITFPIIIIFILCVVGLSSRYVTVFYNKYSTASKSAAVQQGVRSASEVVRVIENYEQISKSIADGLLLLVKNGASRSTVNRYLSTSFANVPETGNLTGWLALWVMFEPNKFDGNDAAHVNNLGDEAGVFTPILYKEDVSAIEYPSFAEEHLADYYVIPKQAKKTTILEPYRYDGQMMSSVLVPLFLDNEFIGVLGVDVKASFLDTILGKETIFDSGYLFLIAESGTIVYDNELETIGENVNEIWRTLYPEDLAAIQDSIRTKHINEVTAWSEGDKKTLTIQYQPVTVGFYNPKTWVVGICIPVEEMRKPITNSIVETIVLCLTCIIVVVVAMLIILRRYSISPLITISKMVAQIAKGDYTTTVPELKKSTKDELTETFASFSTMIEATRDIIGSLKESTAKLSASGEMLQKSVSDTKEQTQAIAQNLDNVTAKTGEQTGHVAKTATEVNSILHNMSDFEDLINEQIESISSSSAAIQQILAAITSLSDAIEGISEQYSTLIQTSKDGVEKQETVETAITEIVALSQNLSATNSMIEEIAKQTNMLAMNAAIEAAHAGDSGKGFAVVAEEIRKLAEDSAQQSAQIKEQIMQITTGVVAIVSASNESKDTFDSLVSMIENIDTKLEDVNRTIAEQAASGREISNSLAKLSDMNAHISTSSKEISQSSTHIAQTIDKLKTISDVVSSSITEMGSEVDAIENAAQTVAEITARTTTHIATMNNKIDRFEI